MTLRIMLVGLVASLGFDLPSGGDLSGWAEAGSSWVAANLVVPSGSPVEIKLDQAVPSDCHLADVPPELVGLSVAKVETSDAAFEVASDALIADLAADLALTSAELDEAAPDLALTSAELDEAAPMLALEASAPINVQEVEAMGCLLPIAVDSAAAEADASVEPAFESTDEVETMVEANDRLSSAVRLTRDAVQAWAALLQQGDQDACPSR